MATWDDTKNKLMGAGFSEDDTHEVAGAIAQKMQSEGYAPEEMADYFGRPKEPDPGQITQIMDQQFRRNMPVGVPKEQIDNDTLTAAVKGAWQGSILGLGTRHQLPTDGLEDPSIFDDPDSLAHTARKAVQGGLQGAIDSPFMAMGALAGAPLGPVGTAAGAFALPEAMRDALVTAYKQGGVHSAKDFTQMADAGFMGGIKGALTGDLVAMTGGATAALTKGASPIVAGIYGVGGETAAMTGFTSAMDGKLPEPQDFVDNALLIGGFHIAGKVLGHGDDTVQSKLGQTYADTGLHPSEVATRAITDPVLKQEMLSKDGLTPPSLDGLREPEVKSDFTVVDGKLIPGDKPEAAKDLDFGKTTLPEFIQDSSERLNMNNRETSARLHDPAAFSAMESMSRDVREGEKQISANNDRLDGLKDSETQLAQLEKVRAQLKAGDLTPEKQSALDKEHTELSDNEDKLRSDGAQAAQIRIENDKINDRIDRVAKGGKLKSRLINAWEKGQSTLESNLKDRIRNKDIQHDNGVDTTPFPHLNPEFNTDGDEVPSAQKQAKEYMSRDENLDQFYGSETRNLSHDEILAHVLRDHAELANRIAPEIVTKETIKGAEGQKDTTTLKVMAKGKRAEEATSVDTMVRNLYNDQHMVHMDVKATEKATGRKVDLDARSDFKVLMARASEREAANMIGNPNEKANSAYGPYDPRTGEKTHDSLVSILREIPKGEEDDARRYVIYKQAIDENAEGRLTGVNDVEARAFVEANKERFDGFQKRLTGWHNAMLQYAVDSGYLTQALKDHLVEKYPNYITATRVTEAGEAKAGAKKGILYDRNGSELPYADPFQSSFDKAQNITREVAKNNAVKAMVKYATEFKDPESQLFKDGQAKVNLDLETEIKKDPSFGTPSDVRASLNKNQVGYFDNGVYKVLDFHDSDLASTLKFVNYNPELMKSIAYFRAPFVLAAQALRFGATTGADFIVKHIMRSEINTSLVSEKMRVPLIGTLMNLPEAFGKSSDMYSLANKAHAFDGVMTDIDKFGSSKAFTMQDKEGMISTTRNTVKSVWGLAHSVMQLTEEAKRLSIFKDKMKDLGPNPTWSDVLDKGWETSRSSVDGLQIGAKMQGLVSVAALTHYETQGFGRFIGAAIDNPERVATRMAMLTGIGLMAWYSHKDDPDYQNIPDFEKNTFIHFKVGDSFIKIPMPWTQGALAGALIPRMADVITKNDPEALKKFGETMADMIPLVNPLNIRKTLDKISLFGTADQLIGNYNSMSGRKIISDHLLEQAPDSQRAPYTSGVAAGIAKILGMLPNALQPTSTHLTSPIMVDHAINMWTGQTGRLAVQAADMALQKLGIESPSYKPAYEWADYPFIGGLMSRHPTYNSQPIHDFDQRFDELSHVAKSYQAFQKSDETNGGNQADDYLQKHPELNQLDDWNEARDAMKEFNTTIQSINLNPNISQRDKQQVMWDTFKQYSVTAKQKLDEINQASKNNR